MKWLLQKNAEIMRRFKKNVSSKKKEFTYPEDITELPHFQLSDDAKKEILQIAKEDLDRQYKKIDDSQLKINFN